MNEILSLVLGSMQADLARMDRVATNLANVQTPGYKRQVASTPPFASYLQQAQPVPAGAPTHDAQPLGAFAVHTDLRAGTLKATGQPLDLALAGPGWFEVASGQGSAYTRQGDFRLDARGRLVTQQGHPVLGTAGEIQLQHGAPLVDAQGRVFERDAGGTVRGAAPVAQLRIVQFESGAVLERAADGLVLARAEPTPVAEGSTTVQQGFLENSNVSQMQEMVQLVQAVRHLETLQKVATSYDEMLATSIRRLGEGA